MVVPKASVDEDHDSPSAKYKVRFSRQGAVMQAKA
jgi:hypothetical protein